MSAVAKTAGRIPIPRVVRRVAGKDDTGTETPSEKVIVEGLPDRGFERDLQEAAGHAER